MGLWLTFIERIVNSLAWPGTVLALALLFRSELREILKGLPRTVSQVKWGKLSVTFATALLQNERSKIPALELQYQPENEKGRTKPSTRPKLTKAAEQPFDLEAHLADRESQAPAIGTNHEGDIENAWRSLNENILRKAQEAGSRRTFTPREALNFLAKHGLNPNQNETYKLLQAFHENRWQASTDPSYADFAREFVLTCRKLIDFMNQFKF